MNLLDDLAKNSCIVNFSMDELMSPSLVDSILSEGSQKSKSLSPQHSYQLIVTEVSEFDEKGGRLSLEEVQQEQSSVPGQYYEKYRSKLKKIGALVSLLSAKTRKYKYQFMIHLERWCKMSEKQQANQKHMNSQHRDPTIKNPMNKGNEARFYSCLQQMIKVIQGKTKEAVRFSFGRVNKRLRSVLKIELAERVIEGIVARVYEQSTNAAFVSLKGYQRIQVKMVSFERVPRAIILSNIFKTAPKRPLLSEIPLSLKSKEAICQSVKLNSIFPQERYKQTIDFCDTMGLFMSEEEKTFLSLSQSAITDGFEPYTPQAEACISVEESKRSQSHKSYVKMMSEIEFTAIPQGGVERRNVSDFIESVGGRDRNYSNYSQVERKEEIYPGVTPTKSELHFCRNSISKEEISEQRRQEPVNMVRRDLVLSYLNDEESIYEERRRLSSQEIRFGGEEEVRAVHCQRKSLSELRGNGEEHYEEDLNRYLRFKRSLQERRKSTLKEIEKSQEMIKKLMGKFKKEKESGKKKPKIILKPEKSRDSYLQSASKQSHLNSVKATSTKMSPARQKSRTELKGRLSLKNSEKEKEEMTEARHKVEQYPVFASYKNMEIYSQYVSEKKRMASQKSTPAKKPSKGKTSEQVPSKTAQKGASGSKTVLNISHFQLQKGKRVDLKVDLCREAPQRMSLASRPKQYKKVESRNPDKPKTRLKKK